MTAYLDTDRARFHQALEQIEGAIASLESLFAHHKACNYPQDRKQLKDKISQEAEELRSLWNNLIGQRTGILFDRQGFHNRIEELLAEAGRMARQ